MKKIFLLLIFSFIYSLTHAQYDFNLDSCIVIQPNAQEGKDAEIFSLNTYGWDTTNFGSIADICATAWTKNGELSIVRSLFAFNLNTIPSNYYIVSAKLSLYHNPNSPEGQHSSLTGSNVSILQRITSIWDENTVTWSNQPNISSTDTIILAASNSATQNFIDIDVTNLVIDMHANPNGNFGFMFSQQTEQSYRKLVFASSDHPIDSLHPKLEICIAKNTNNIEHSMQKYYSIKIFPNPACQYIDIQLKNHLASSIEIYDMVGKMVKSVALNKRNSIRVDISKLEMGLYLAVVKDENGMVQSVEKFKILH